MNPTAMPKNEITYYHGDIPQDFVRLILDSYLYLAIDTETTGLSPKTGAIKLVQINAGSNFFLVRVDKRKQYPNLIELFNTESIKKIFHNAIFDIRFLKSTFQDLDFKNIRCTKISEKLITGKNNSSLKNITKKYLNIELDKSERLSNWATSQYSKNQIEYAINDVKYLNELWNIQKNLLQKVGRLDLAYKCFEFIPAQIEIENLGYNNIFTY